MKREELLKSKEYWVEHFQLYFFHLIESYRIEKGYTKTQLAEHLGVTKGYISQVLNGDYDHKISKLIEFCLAFDKVPIIQYIDINEYIKKEEKFRNKAIEFQKSNYFKKMKSQSKK